MKRFFASFGPWPFQPTVLAIIVFALVATYAAGVFTREALFQNGTIAYVVLPALVAGGVAYVVFSLGRQWQLRRGVHWPSYLVTLLACAVPVAVLRFGLGFGPVDDGSAPLVFFGGIFRVFLGVFVAMAVVGSVSNRLQRQIALTEEALALAQRQQVQIIAADEEARRQASALLHDRVQAGLLSSCLELQQFKRDLPTDRVEHLQPIIDRLETLRSFDVRSAARVLSPNLADVDLQTALEELAMQYETHLLVHVRVSKEIDRDRAEVGQMVLLGAYRIVEQALLNAAVHAQASEVTITISREGPLVSVSVSDDGVGMSDDVKTGTGTALIETWTRSLHGSWRWEPHPAGTGTVLVAGLREP